MHDCGTLVNPRSLAGHIVGGTAQGIGTALYEEYVYDEDGQLLTSSYLDYLIPTAMEVPELKYRTRRDAVALDTPHGIKGGGEGGRMMAPGRDQRGSQRRARPARRPADRAADDSGPNPGRDPGRPGVAAMRVARRTPAGAP